VTAEGAAQRKLYLPAGGDWVDFWSGKRLSGGQTITADSPLDRIPIYAKAGSIVPIGPAVQFAGEKADPIEIRVYGGANADFNLYEDEVDSYDYEHGAYATIPMHWDDKAGTLTIGERKGTFPSMLQHRTFHVVLAREGRGTGISQSSQPDTTIEYQGKDLQVVLHANITEGIPNTPTAVAAHFW